MKIRLQTLKHIGLMGLFALVTASLYIWFSQTEHYEAFTMWTESNRAYFLVFLVLIKIVGVVWPPVPGGIFTLGAIPIIGWELAYLTDLIGSTIGSTVAFFIARKHGMKILSWMFDETTVSRIANFKIKENREVEAIIMLRLALGTTLVEAVSWGAGVMKIRFKSFLLGIFVSHIIIGVPIFFIASNFFRPDRFAVNAVLIVLVLPILWKLRTRYFE